MEEKPVVPIKVKSIRRVARRCPVYNIDTGPNHNYFASRVLVHNCDDPNDAAKVEGEANRKRVINWWKDAFYDRVNDPMTGRRVVVGQRTHRQDLIGFLLETGEFEELRIPEEFQPTKRIFTSIGWTDPRTVEGELLRPNRFGEKEVKAARKRLGSSGYRAKHNQDPQETEGNQFKAEWFKHRWRYCNTDPNMIVLEDENGKYQFDHTKLPRFATCDPAASSKRTADFTVFGIWLASPRGDLIWLDCLRRQVDIPDQPKLLEEVYAHHRFSIIGIEAVGANRSMYAFAKTMSFNTIQLTPKGMDKLAHAQGALILAESGSLWLPDRNEVRGFPIDEVESELLQFTGGPDDEHDDVIDVLSYACDMRQKIEHYRRVAGSNNSPITHDPFATKPKQLGMGTHPLAAKPIAMGSSISQNKPRI